MSQKNRLSVALIGAGNMGAAFAECFIKARVLRVEDLLVVERDARRRSRIVKNLGCRAYRKIPKEFSACSVVFLATKPQDLAEVSTALQEHLSVHQVVVSILAGIDTPTLRRALGGQKRIIRCMPNLPAQIGRGVSVFSADASVPRTLRKSVAKLFSSAGYCLEVDEPNLIDAATAVSASGCGFVFYLLEHFLLATRKLGFSEQEAEKIVLETFAGTLALWSAYDLSPCEWREKVTSKRGTTEAGLKVFKRYELGQGLQAGLMRAFARCAELRKR